ncbi:amino acid permease [Bacillus subtilis]|uniref:Amino acid permease n=1 Tax=Bacillus subtilis TaxID=1423 RepID=A0A0D1KCG8_BACIU|nr:amino acid permease [Bacillus subtilis]
MMQNHKNELQRSMKSRHLFMIALGGVIGTGLFLGSGFTISQAGPLGAIAAYIIGGFLMYLVMLCLGELAVAMPVAGSFQAYATKFLGPSTGFMIGWLYWFSWANTVGLELTSAGILMQRWLPSVPIWIWCLVFGIVIFLINALSVRSFAEMEFWFSSIKVAAIILFIVIGGAAVFGLIDFKGGQETPFLSNFMTDRGLFPNGVLAVMFTLVMVNFSFQGTELVGIAAGESESPFVAVLDQIGIPFSADIMNFVILTAILSVANSGLYAASRMMWSLSSNQMGPSFLTRLTKKGVPMNALLITLGISGCSLLTSVMAAETVYLWCISISGMVTVVAWMSICASQFFFRRRFLAEGGNVNDLEFRTPLYPLVPILGFCLYGCVLISLIFIPDQRIGLYCGVPIIIFCYAYYHLSIKKRINHESIEKKQTEAQ